MSRGDHLLAYEYPVDGETGYATFDSPLDGVVAAYGNVKAGTTVTAATAAAGEPVVHIQQACDHPVQFHNMCAVCGVDLSNQDDQVAALNHGVEIEHNESGVTVSLEVSLCICMTSKVCLLMILIYASDSEGQHISPIPPDIPAVLSQIGPRHRP